VTNDLMREVEALRERLAEAEDMRMAITRAEVDGFVVGETDDNRYVHLLSGAYTRDVARHRAADERTRRFLSLLATELLTMLKTMRVSVELLKTQSLAEECRRAVDSLDSQIGTMRRLAEDLNNINPPGG
jgi:hypothetical protein